MKRLVVLLHFKRHSPEEYQHRIRFGERHTERRDQPEFFAGASLSPDSTDPGTGWPRGRLLKADERETGFRINSLLKVDWTFSQQKFTCGAYSRLDKMSAMGRAVPAAQDHMRMDARFRTPARYHQSTTTAQVAR
jgi:hypothetical protein